MPLSAADSVLEAAVADERVPGAVAVVADRQGCRYRRSVGALCTEPRIEMSEDPIFRIASMTKLVTSVALMQLVDEGQLELDQPLAAYLPNFEQPPVLVSFDAATSSYSTRLAKRQATLRELLSHTAGYGYWFLDAPLRVVSGKEPDVFNPPFLMHEPGERFAYSTSTDVAGQVVAPVTGLTLDQYFARRLFEPLAMADTGFSLPADTARLTRVHRRKMGRLKPLPLEKADHPVRGGGGLYSTAADFTRLLQCLLNGGEFDGVRLLSSGAAAEISRNQIGDDFAAVQTTALSTRSNDFIFMDGTQRFGLGVMLDTRDRPGGRSAGSYGWAGIFNTYFWVDPTADITVVLMLQVAPFAAASCVAVLDAFEQAVYRDLEAGVI